MKKIIRYLLYSLLAILLALFILPYAFRDSLINELKKAINNNVNADVDFEGLNLSLIRDFPEVSIDILLLTVDGINEFKGERLFESDKLHLTSNWSSLLKPSKGIELLDIEVKDARLNIIVNSDSIFNYDILKDNDTEQKMFFGDIKHYKFTNSMLSYRDNESEIELTLDSIMHEGSGNFKNNIFDLLTETRIEKIDFNYQGIPFIKDSRAAGSMVIGIDLNEESYQFGENSFRFNDLEFSILGFLKSLEKSWEMDLSFKAINNEVSSVVSLIPNMYTSDFENLKTNGAGSISATIKGIYDEVKTSYPSILMSIILSNAEIQYPGMPYPIKDINSKIQVNAKQGDWEDMTLDISRFDFLLDGKPFGSRLKISNLFGNQHYQGQLLGSLDLKVLTQAVPIEETRVNSGLLSADLKIDAKQSDVINKNYSQISFGGQFNVKTLDLIYAGKPLSVEESKAQVNPSSISIDLKEAIYGQSDMTGNLKVTNPLSILTSNNESLIELELKSRTLDLNEIQNGLSTSSQDESSDYSFDYPHLNIKTNISIDKMLYSDQDIRNLKMNATYADNQLDIKNVSMSLNDDALLMRGQVNNILPYLSNKDTLYARLFIETPQLDINKFTNPSASAPTKPEQIILPKDIDLELHADVGKMDYSKLVFNNFNAKLEIKNGVLSIENAGGDLFTGRALFEGSYDCSNIDNPLFNFRYDLSQIPFTKLFESSEIFSTLAPLVEFIEGKFNSTLVLSGPIGENMMPLLTKIDASGFIETLNAQIGNFPVMNNISNKLGIESIKKWYLEDSRNWFVVKDGSVELKPMSYLYDDMSFDLAGSYSLDNSIDLKVKADIPRAKLKESSVTAGVDKGIQLLEKEASALGIKINSGSHLYLDILVGGKIKSPSIKIIPVGSGGEKYSTVVENKIKDETDRLKDSINSRIEKEKTQVKDTIGKVVSASRDSLTKKSDAIIKETTQKVEDKIKSQIDSSLTRAGIDTSLVSKDKIEDILDKAGKSDIDSIKSKLNNWNPFKKKKN